MGKETSREMNVYLKSCDRECVCDKCFLKEKVRRENSVRIISRCGCTCGRCDLSGYVSPLDCVCCGKKRVKCSCSVAEINAAYDGLYKRQSKQCRIANEKRSMMIGEDESWFDQDSLVTGDSNITPELNFVCELKLELRRAVRRRFKSRRRAMETTEDLGGCACVSKLRCRCGSSCFGCCSCVMAMDLKSVFTHGRFQADQEFAQSFLGAEQGWSALFQDIGSILSSMRLFNKLEAFDDKIRLVYLCMQALKLVDTTAMWNSMAPYLKACAEEFARYYTSGLDPDKEPGGFFSGFFHSDMEGKYHDMYKSFSQRLKEMSYSKPLIFAYEIFKMLMGYVLSKLADVDFGVVNFLVDKTMLRDTLNVNFMDMIFAAFETMVKAIDVIRGKTTLSEMFNKDDTRAAVDLEMLKFEAVSGCMNAKDLSPYGFRDARDIMVAIVNTEKKVRKTLAGFNTPVCGAWSAKVARRLGDFRMEAAAVIGQSGMRAAPLGLLLYGGSSRVKTSVANILLARLFRVMGVPYDSSLVCNLNTESKYQDEYKNHHLAVFLDDLANRVRAAGENPEQNLLIRLINNAPGTAVKAALHEKGTVYFNPSVVIGTTNVKNLDAPNQSLCPESILRRMPWVVTVEIKKEYVRDGLATVDWSKVPSTQLDAIDIWDLVLEEVVVVKNAENRNYRYREVARGGIDEIGDRIVDIFKGHLVNQGDLLSSYVNLADIPMCDMCCNFTNKCRCLANSAQHSSGAVVGVEESKEPPLAEAVDEAVNVMADGVRAQHIVEGAMHSDFVEKALDISSFAKLFPIFLRDVNTSRILFFVNLSILLITSSLDTGVILKEYDITSGLLLASVDRYNLLCWLCKGAVVLTSVCVFGLLAFAMCASYSSLWKALDTPLILKGFFEKKTVKRLGLGIFAGVSAGALLMMVKSLHTLMSGDLHCAEGEGETPVARQHSKLERKEFSSGSIQMATMTPNQLTSSVFRNIYNLSSDNGVRTKVFGLRDDLCVVNKHAWEAIGSDQEGFVSFELSDAVEGLAKNVYKFKIDVEKTYSVSEKDLVFFSNRKSCAFSRRYQASVGR